MRRGRRHPEDLATGDTVDFWRVETYESGRRLRLFAEMKLPGRAWLEFEVHPDREGATIRQTAVFDPIGVLGLLYWYGIYPLHTRVFAGMLRGVAQAAMRVTDDLRKPEAGDHLITGPSPTAPASSYPRAGCR